MEEKEYRLIYKEGSGEVIEKKSRFISDVFIVETEEQAQGYIAAIKKKHWDARHSCFAYAIGERCELQRCSDDGEPQGTAGKPILEVIMGNNLHNCLIVVTRYFGGTLLGTGGLVRAYQSSAKEGILACTLARKIDGRRIVIETDYNGLGRIQYLAEQENITIEDIQYTDKVTITVVASNIKADDFINKVTEATSAKAVFLENVSTDIILPII